jgi:endonuclease/exonuclease/phosphatase family metal-dependent hydrolase
MMPFIKNLIAKISIIILILGVFTSFYNLGFISVVLSVLLPILFSINVFLGVYGIFKKKYFYFTGVLLFLICFNFFIRYTTTEPSQSLKTVTVLSYNVRGFNSDNDSNDKEIASKIIQFIDSINPDVLVIQESSYKESRAIKGYSHSFLGYRKDVKKTLLAIYSKYPIIKTGYIDFPNTTNNGIYADLKIHQDTIRLYNVHLQSFRIELNTSQKNSNIYTTLFRKLNTGITKQIEQAKLIKKEVNNSTKKVIICGDFNATPFSLPYRILKKGLNDSFISKGSGFGTTYALFGYPLRLDFFLLDKQIDIIRHDNFKLKLSDHEPILLKFKF